MISDGGVTRGVRRSILSALVLAGSSTAWACGGEGAEAGDEDVSTETSAEVVDPTFDPRPWLDDGQVIQQATFATLSGALQNAMAEGGVTAALRYCNTAAYPLTDSLSAEYGVSIRRATERPRNPSNRAMDRESAVLSAYRDALAAGEQVAPRVHEVDDSTVVYYAPIRAQPLCLNCHGTVGREVTPAAADLIAELYPADEALGYAEGDLRGIWSLMFRR